MSSETRPRSVAVIPSLITLANLACGVGALLWLWEAGQNADYELVKNAGWLLVLAVFFDAIDGKLARLTKSTSDLGAQLDSLADLVTFGLVPAFLIRTLVQLEGPSFDIVPHPRIMVVGPILYTCCAALRLARYNVMHAGEDMTKGTAVFIGLPSPGAASLPIAMVLFYFGISDPAFLIPVSAETIHLVRELTLRSLPFLLVVLGVLMVSNLPFPHFVAWASRTRHPFQRIAEITIILGLLFVEPELALLLLSICFILLPGLIASVRLLHQKLRGRSAA